MEWRSRERYIEAVPPSLKTSLAHHASRITHSRSKQPRTASCCSIARQTNDGAVYPLTAQTSAIVPLHKAPRPSLVTRLLTHLLSSLHEWKRQSSHRQAHSQPVPNTYHRHLADGFPLLSLPSFCPYVSGELRRHSLSVWQLLLPPSLSWQGTHTAAEFLRVFEEAAY